MRPVLQPGNAVRVTWRARLDEHLGHYSVEGPAAARRRIHDRGACGLTA
jgi:DNA repair protein RecO (recombination protein O)